MKKLSLVLVLMLVLSLVACTQPAQNTDANGGQTNGTPFTGKYIVNANYVKDNLDKIILVDARGEEAAAKKTVKGAIPLMWQFIATCADGSPGDANWGCILDPERLSKNLSEKGIDPSKEIVLFAASQQGWGDDGRIAWELICAGYKNVKMVDGGFAALEKAGLETVSGGATPVAVDVKIDSIDQTRIINTDELKANYDSYKIVDVRADKEYNGEVLYGEAKGGRLPGAIHIKFESLFNEDGTLKSNVDLTKMFEDAGLKKDDKIATYCTAGIRSGYMQLIMEMCGFTSVKNYDESFYRWCAVEEVEK